MFELVKSRLAPFRIRTFRLFYSAQAISLVGNWMQELAKSWIVINLIGKASAMGSLLFAAAIPNLLLGSMGGVWADQKGIKSILVVTQIALATLAFALGILVYEGHVQMWHLMVFALMEGCIIAFDMPAFQKITPQLVPKEDFQQALALNAVNFHLSRVVGPSIAGLIMALSGPATVFWMNAVSFLGVVFVISRLPFGGTVEGPPMSSNSMREAWNYVRKHPMLSHVIAQLIVLMSIVFPLVFTTLRVFVQERFHLSSREFGLVFACPGLGALMGSLIFLLWSPKNPLKVLPLGISGLVLFLVLLAEAQSLLSTVIFLTLFSVCMFLTISSLNVTIQLRIENAMRGRISALIGMLFVSLAPIMSLPMGFLSDVIGERRLMWTVAVTFLGLSMILAYKDRKSTRASTVPMS